MRGQGCNSRLQSGSLCSPKWAEAYRPAARGGKRRETRCLGVRFWDCSHSVLLSSPCLCSKIMREQETQVGNVLCVIGQASLPLWAPLNVKRGPTVMSAFITSVILKPPAPLSKHSQHAAPAELTPTTTPSSAKVGFSWRNNFPAGGIWKFFQSGMRVLQHLLELPMSLASLTMPSAHLGWN